MRHAFRIIAILGLLLAPALAAGLAPTAARAADDPSEETLGKVTDLPLPRYVSLKTDEANVRRGPATEHRVDWQFLRRGMPLRVVAEHGPWRRVQDLDDVVGWVHSALLSRTRTAIVTATPDAMLRETPAEDARPTARIERGVILRILACAKGWCRLEKDGHRGWMPKADFWGADAAEEFE